MVLGRYLAPWLLKATGYDPRTAFDDGTCNCVKTRNAVHGITYVEREPRKAGS